MKDLLQRLLQGDNRAMARAITQVENRSEESMALLRALFPHTGRSRVVGVTGSPGAGKSSLVDRLAAAYRRRDHTLGIIAVDPTSPFTGGAILGDRIRMTALSTDPGIFIRSMATRGHLGGVAATTADVVSVMDAASRDPILVETVGVGQDEVDIARIADVSVVIFVPGMGDDIQALKAGIMEIGDVFVINKSDRPGVDRMERSLLSQLALAQRPDGWNPPVVRTVATEDKGTEELIEAIHRCYEYFQGSGQRAERKRQAVRQRLLALLQERLMQAALQDGLPPEELDSTVGRILDHETDPYTVVDAVIRRMTNPAGS